MIHNEMVMDIGKRMDDKRIRILLFQCFSNYIPENQHDWLENPP